MRKCACCDGKIKRGESVVHESCSEVDPDDEKRLALETLRANWLRVRDETAIAQSAATTGDTVYAVKAKSWQTRSTREDVHEHR